MSKKHRVIGDPLRKFKQPNIKQQCPPAMRKALEATMEIDHRAGQPFSAALIVSSKSGLPDKWFFEKARSLGYVIDDEKAFWEAQRLRLKTEKIEPKSIEERVTESVADIEQKMRRQDEESFEEMVLLTAGNIENWRKETRTKLLKDINETEEKIKKLASSGQVRPL